MQNEKHLANHSLSPFRGWGSLSILLLLRVKNLSIHITRSYGTYQVYEASAIGTTDMDAMEFIPLKIGEGDIDAMRLNIIRPPTPEGELIISFVSYFGLCKTRNILQTIL